jgi:hypothetical protein
MREIRIELGAPWHKFLTEIDEQLTAPVQINCIGGFVVTNVHGLSRNTGDLDHVQSPKTIAAELQRIGGKGSPLHKKYHLYVDYVPMVTMSINFEERLSRLEFGFRNLQIYIPDVYDLILSKLERNSPKDYSDVQFLAEKYDLSFATVRQRFDDELDFIPNRERHINSLEFWRDWFRE